jgi:tetratricopeptide (TPR) repeat protein
VLAGREEALAWLEAERPHAVAAVVWAAGQDDAGLLHLATQLARRLHMFLFHRGYLSDDIRINHAARTAARRGHDAAAEVWACLSLAATCGLQGRPGQALTWLTKALSISRGLGDAHQLATCLNHLSDTWWRLGERDRCEPALREEMTLRVAMKDHYGEAFCRLNLAEVSCWKGLFDDARAYYQQALAKFCESGDKYGEALARHGLGSVLEQEGRPAEAVRDFADAAAMLRGQANRSALGYMLVDLGRAHRQQGQRVQALSFLYEGLRLCREQGMRGREVEYLRELSIVLGTLVPQQADRYHQQSLTILGELRRRG